ncbi:C4b-binding protein beta chain-like [Amphiura filiformis]|uniref:C4b-binding protein beta chain-like n=1 Tax=Amphiura filiformis TaxID=82378 RepID=UPI003B2139A0
MKETTSATVPLEKDGRCLPINKPKDGSVDPVKDFYTFGDVITVYCRQGFQLIGDEHLFCSDTGEWLGETPKCSIENQTGISLTIIEVAGVAVGGGIIVGIAIGAIVLYYKYGKSKEKQDEVLHLYYS